MFFYEFLVCFRRCLMELIKMNSSDCPYTYPWKRIGTKYNNQTGLKFMMADVELLMKQCQRNKLKVDHSLDNLSSDNIQKCISLTSQFPPTRKRLTIRESTAKENPLLVSNIHFFCSFPNCDRGSPFKYQGALRNHLKSVHSCTPRDAEDFLNTSVSSPEFHSHDSCQVSSIVSADADLF